MLVVNSIGMSCGRKSLAEILLLAELDTAEVHHGAFRSQKPPAPEDAAGAWQPHCQGPPTIAIKM
eukprot:1119495-Amphidinium_carterae.1